MAASIQNRSFGGCDTCRARHVKCDEGAPACAMCVASGLVCGGYRKSLFFFNTTGSSNNGEARFRRTVLTEAQRESMSRSLIASVPPSSTSKWILQLENECENIPASQSIAITRGPFGAFRVVHDSANIYNSSRSEPDNVSHSQSQNIDDFNIALNDHSSATDPDLIAYEPEPEPISALQPAELWNEIAADDDDIERILEQSNPLEMEGLVSDQLTFQSYLHPHFPSVDHSIETAAVDSLISLLGAQNTAPPDATFLLKHYSTNILSYYSPFRDAKTPWHILVVPQAKTCLASLSIGECPDHASLCTFYGVLAVSALSLGDIMGSVAWIKDKSRLYKQRAHSHCQQMLMRAYESRKSAKYKAILMALIIMIQLTLITGNRDQCDYYFLEAEKFIRLKGLNRKKSRKVRLLHHCYAYERILWETTSPYDQNSAYRAHVRSVVEASGLTIYCQDSPAFRLPKWQDLEQEMMTVKSLEEGENDLLSERLGIYFATLYPEIFGVPEPCVLMISLIVRLGREKDAAETRSTSDPLDLAGFLRWAKLIEKGIAELNHLDPTVQSIGMGHRVVDQHQLSRVFTALRNAISIFFYRRIYEHEAPRLKQKIELIRDALYRDETEGSTSPFGTAQLIWSAFIAGCEAEGLQMQASFSTWFEESARRSGLQFFTDAVKRLHKVWKIKRDLNGKEIKWMDLMKQAEIQPVHV